MSWRTVVISSSAKLDYQQGYLVVRTDQTQKIFINEIAVLILESTAVSLTSYLLNELVKKKVKIIFCDEKRNPFSELMPCYGSHDSSLKIKNQMAWQIGFKTELWTEIVSEKIKNQALLLKKVGKVKEHQLLLQYIGEMETGDISNREGHAAKVYFNALYGMDFTRTSDSSTNAALNYGYAIILSAFNREIAACGYLTQLGIFHDNMFNPFNLASDIMEPFRILIDEWVYHMNPEIFEHFEKMEMVRLLQKEVFIEGRREVVLNAIKIYTKSIFDALNEQDLSMIKFYRNELSLYESIGDV